MMEMLLRASALSQKRPLLVPACWHRSAAQQDNDQAASALRPYANTKAQKESVGVEREQLGKDQVLVLPGSVAVLALFSRPPLHTGTALAAPEKVSEKGSQTNKSLQGPVFSLKHREHGSSLHNLWVTQDRQILN